MILYKDKRTKIIVLLFFNKYKKYLYYMDKYIKKLLLEYQ